MNNDDRTSGATIGDIWPIAPGRHTRPLPTSEVQLELDCYHKAEHDEPKFTLLARDPIAAHMVALWAALRKGDTVSALGIFSDTVTDPAYQYSHTGATNEDKLKSACDIAREMIAWRESKSLETFELYTVS